MIIVDELLSVGLVHRVDVRDGLGVEEEGGPEDPKLFGLDRRPRFNVFQGRIVIRRLIRLSRSRIIETMLNVL